MVTLITGGTRSGKSRYAEQRALELSSSPVFVATAKVLDAEFEARVERHKQDRGPQWTTYETNSDFHRLSLQGKTVVIDCVTLWLSDLFSSHQQDTDHCLKCFKQQFEELRSIPGRFFIISNEIGMGVHAHSETGRKFTDLQGWANQYIALKAEEVVCMISGLPFHLKSPQL